MTWWLYGLLVTLAVTTANKNSAPSDCVVCLHGNCHSSAVIYDYRHLLDPSRIAMNFNDNILYYNNNGKIIAINLDDKTRRGKPIPMEEPEIYNMGVDQITGDVYYFRHGTNENKIYKYQVKTNDTKIIEFSNPDNKKPPFRLWALNGKVYFNRLQDDRSILEKGLNTLEGSTIQRVPELEEYPVQDVVFGAPGTMYIRSARYAYKLEANEDGTHNLTKIERPDELWALEITGKNGELYAFDISKNLIYQYNTTTEKFDRVGAYAVQRFAQFALFDNNGNIVFKTREEVSYYKATNDKCVIDAVKDGVNITKV